MVNNMDKIIKTLRLENGTLNVITGGNRMHLADFSGTVEIHEHQNHVSILGNNCKGQKKIYASFILCSDVDYCMDDEFSSGKVYEASCDVYGERKCERLFFSGMRFEDSNPLDGSVTFEITDLELIRKMINM